MAYDPSEFDAIREKLEKTELHVDDKIWLERLAIWLFIGFTVSVVAITLLFAAKTQALETVDVDGNFALSSIYSSGLTNSDRTANFQIAPSLWAKFSAGVSVPGGSGIDMAISFGPTNAVVSSYS